jgi:hypothetical protein
MKLKPDKVAKAASGINRMIGGIPRRLQETIKGLFYLFVFILTVAGGVYGVVKGRDSAKIKSAPIVESTNDALELDMKRERNDGDFSSMLGSDLISEEKKSGVPKTEFPTRVNMEPEVDKGIVEPEKQKTVKPSGQIMTREPIFEDEGGSRPSIDSRVEPVGKRSMAAKERDETIVPSEQKKIRGLDGKRAGMSGAEMRRAERKSRAEMNNRRRDIRAPQRQNDEGMIED